MYANDTGWSGVTEADYIISQAPVAPSTISVTVRVEGPDYTILPQTTVQAPVGASDIQVLQAAGLTVGQSSGFINTINGVGAGNGYWEVTPYESSFNSGDSVVFDTGDSGNLAQIAVPTSATAGSAFTVSVTNYDHGGWYQPGDRERQRR